MYILFILASLRSCVYCIVDGPRYIIYTGILCAELYTSL